MELHHCAASRQQQGGGGGDGGGVKVKFIETQFVSSDAASFKALVQRLTGRSAAPSPSTSPPQPAAPRPNRPRARAAVAQCPGNDAGWAGRGDHYAARGGGGGDLMAAAPLMPKQEACGGAGAQAASLEYLPHELCDFTDLLYAGGARRVDGAGYGFPYY